MSENLTLAELTDCGAHRRGHFRLSSGLHSADYLQCALFLADTARAERAGRLLAAAVRDLELSPSVVVSPALGALIIGHEVARALGTPFLFAERAGGDMVLRRGFTVPPGEPVLIVEDVITTGHSAHEVAALLDDSTSRTIGLASLINRSGTTNPFAPLSYRALLEVDFPTWSPESCPLCRDGAPIERPGSRPIT